MFQCSLLHFTLHLETHISPPQIAFYPPDLDPHRIISVYYMVIQPVSSQLSFGSSAIFVCAITCYLTIVLSFFSYFTKNKIFYRYQFIIRIHICKSFLLVPIFKEISTLLSIKAVLVCIPTNSVRGFPFLHTLSSIYFL